MPSQVRHDESVDGADASHLLLPHGTTQGEAMQQDDGRPWAFIEKSQTHRSPPLLLSRLCFEDGIINQITFEIESGPTCSPKPIVSLMRKIRRRSLASSLRFRH